MRFAYLFSAISFAWVLAVVKGFQASSIPPCRKSTQLSLALEGVGSVIDSFYQTQPYLSAFLTCSVKASAADFFAQTKDDDQDGIGPERVDVQRNVAFLMYGGLYQGMVQQFIYSNIYPHFFGNGESITSVALQVITDMSCTGPFVCLPMAYIVKGAFTCDEISMDTMKKAMEKYVEDVTERGLLLKFWSLWVPVQILTFGVVPHHFRIAFVAAVSFFWVFILSSVSGSAKKPETVSDVETVTPLSS